jgi:hypothetical protein
MQEFTLPVNYRELKIWERKYANSIFACKMGNVAIAESRLAKNHHYQFKKKQLIAVYSRQISLTGLFICITAIKPA